ncbi:diguanylate cyclase [Actibacterium lipolyticum]|uniref:diguanylate cyclase n=1 Tax=Actibacterium lipolyticum TaxID=1524263 RepID=A0A238JSK0_9RHOB|nr:diguanylate cyclase [Actibacterium lipolyticum]SMX33154.1 Response regulator PleD [Actibacterium lipolyticum]
MPGRILVVDDVATNRIVMKVRLSEACYDVLQADGGLAALDVARQERPDLILLDVVMSDLNGIEVCRRLKADPETAEIPVIMVTAGRNADEKLCALQAGAEEFLSKPLDEVTLLARVRSLLRARETAKELALRDGTRRALGFSEAAQTYLQKGKVALIASQRELAVEWKAQLSGRFNGAMKVMTRAEALALPNAEKAPDLFVISVDVDRSDGGLRLLSELRSRAATRNSAVVVVVPERAQDSAAMALDLGANDLVTAPFDPAEMALRLETQLTRKYQADRLRASVKDGLRLAVTDPLTGLFNRRYAMPHLARIAERATETRRPFAIMLLDLDRFKTVNDRFGHASGDAVLEQVAHMLTGELRAVDLVARIGGEEFLVALPETSLTKATSAAERLRERINQTPVTLPGSMGSLSVSVSIGLAISDGRDVAIDALMARADAALYAAKAEGRNTVTVSP